MVNPHDLALATIQNLNERPHSPERAAHKINMIRIAERSHAGLPVDLNEALGQIEAACLWCG